MLQNKISPFKFRLKGKTGQFILDENNNKVFCLQKALNLVNKDVPFCIYNDWCKYYSPNYDKFNLRGDTMK